MQSAHPATRIPSKRNHGKVTADSLPVQLRCSRVQLRSSPLSMSIMLDKRPGGRGGGYVAISCHRLAIHRTRGSTRRKHDPLVYGTRHEVAEHPSPERKPHLVIESLFREVTLCCGETRSVLLYFSCHYVIVVCYYIVAF